MHPQERSRHPLHAEPARDDDGRPLLQADQLRPGAAGAGDCLRRAPRPATAAPHTVSTQHSAPCKRAELRCTNANSAHSNMHAKVRRVWLALGGECLVEVVVGSDRVGAAAVAIVAEDKHRPPVRQHRQAVLRWARCVIHKVCEVRAAGRPSTEFEVSQVGGGGAEDGEGVADGVVLADGRADQGAAVGQDRRAVCRQDVAMRHAGGLGLWVAANAQKTRPSPGNRPQGTPL